MAITIPDSDEYKEVEQAVTELAKKEWHSKTKMAVILIKEALEARN